MRPGMFFKEYDDLCHDCCSCADLSTHTKLSLKFKRLKSVGLNLQQLRSAGSSSAFSLGTAKDWCHRGGFNRKSINMVKERKYKLLHPAVNHNAGIGSV